MKISYIKLKQYKYELSEDLIIYTNIVGYTVYHEFFTLTIDGRLTINKRYKWDGVSGGMVDTDNTMIGGCGHDAGYQMIRLGLIPLLTKPLWDDLLKTLFKSCGMSSFRACYSYQAVDKLGYSSCVVGDVHIPKVITLEC